jgi:phospholipid/cholesterol/gamma-HCH transport system permease protein
VILGSRLLLLLRTVKSIRSSGLEMPELKRELREIIFQSGLLVSFGMAFFGSVLASIAWAQARKYTGNVTLVGPPYFELIVREFAPLLAALLVASRQAAFASAELGAMKVNEQLDALRMCAGDPLSFLVAPRILASLIAMPLLTLIGIATSTLAAVATISALGANGLSFASPQLIQPADLVAALVKAGLCGIFIPLCACYRGLDAGRDAASVGHAVTSAVVDATLGCIFIDFAVALGFYAMDLT